MAFVAAHVTRSRVIRLPAALERVFPLFEPLGERAWAAEWNPRMLYPADGTAREGTVFTTEHPGEETTIWTITRYDASPRQIVYSRVTPGLRAGLVEVRCEAAEGDGATRATVTYTYTALSEEGNALLAAFTEARYALEMAAWERAISHYLAHGVATWHV